MGSRTSKENFEELSRKIVFICLGSLGSNAQYIEAVHTALVRHKALLTAEPEPCARCSRKAAGDCDPCGPPAWESFLEPEMCEDLKAAADMLAMDCIGERIPVAVKKIAMHMEAYASQVADNRAEALLEQVETLREFVSEAVQWSEAYPEHIFTAPTPEQVDSVCKTLGFRIDRISAMVLRDFTGRWSNKARVLLAATETNP